MPKEYDTFAHEIASLKRRSEDDKGDDTSTKASGTRCAACGLECAVAAEERTTCQKCLAVHYCSSQCLQWDWTSGGHEEVCPKKPPRKRLAFLKFQSNRSVHSTRSGGPSCCACGLECRVVGTERTTCPQCEEAHYCSADCMNWDWEKGGHAKECLPKKLTLTDFHRSLDQKLPQIQMQQQLAAAQYLASQQGEGETLAEYTIQEETVQDTEYTEETFEDTVVGPPQSKNGSDESRDDAEEETIIEETITEEYEETEEEDYEEETFHDEGEVNDEGETNVEQKDEQSDTLESDLESLQINRYASLMAACGAPYRRGSGTPDSGTRAVYRHASGATPDTPETMVTSNLHHQGTQEALQRLQQQLAVEQQQLKYRKDIENYYSQPEPEPFRSMPLPVYPNKPVILPEPTAQVLSPHPYPKPTHASHFVRSDSNHSGNGNPRHQSIQAALEQYRQQSAVSGEAPPPFRRQRRRPNFYVGDGVPPTELDSSQPLARDLQQQSSSNVYNTTTTTTERGRSRVREFQDQAPSSVYIPATEMVSPAPQSPVPPPQQQPSSSTYYNVLPSEMMRQQQPVRDQQQQTSQQQQQLSSSAYYNVLPSERVKSQQPPSRELQQKPSSSAYFNVVPSERSRSQPRELLQQQSSSAYLNVGPSERAKSQPRELTQQQSSNAYVDVGPSERAKSQPQQFSNAYLNVGPSERARSQPQLVQQQSSSAYLNVGPSERARSQPQLVQQQSSSAYLNVGPSERSRPQYSVRERQQQPSSSVYFNVSRKDQAELGQTDQQNEYAPTFRPMRSSPGPGSQRYESASPPPLGTLRQEYSHLNPRNVPHADETGRLIVPASRVASSSKIIMDDVEVPSSAAVNNKPHGNDHGGYEFLSSLTQISPKRRCGSVAVIIAFTIGIILTASAASGLLWFKPEIMPGNDTTRQEDGVLVSPTAAPTQPPEPIDMSLEIKFQSSNSGFGASVALTESAVAIGSTSGQVVTYHRNRNDGAWSLGQELKEAVSNSSYGADIDMAVDNDGELFLLVGAPEAGKGGTAYFYSYKPSSNTWVELGVSLAGIVGSDQRRTRRLGPSDLEKFGSSVAVSRNRRIVIGAPGHNLNGRDSGRVYIYHFSKSIVTLDLLPTSNHDIEGVVANGKFGSAVDISEDGSTIGIGAVGDKKFYIYEWNGLEWIMTFQMNYPRDVDLGASVAFLSNDFVAVGAPGAEGRKGRIRVCKKEGENWLEIPGIVGESNESLGASGTIGGSVGTRGPELVVSSAAGVVRRHDLIENIWVKRFEIDRNAPGAVIAVTKENGYEMIVGSGGANFVTLYSNKPSIRPSAPTGSSPATQPVPGPTASTPSTEASSPAAEASTPATATGASTIGPQPTPTQRPTVTQPIQTSQPPTFSQPTPSAPASSAPITLAPIGNQPTSAPATGQPGPTPTEPTTSAPAPNGGVSQPTNAPTTSPNGATPTTSIPANAPTPVPTNAPTPEPRWLLVGFPVTSTNTLDGFGESVSIAGDFMVVSEPRLFTDVGQVHLYQRASEWNALNRVFDADAQLFGSSLDLAVVSGTGRLFIGAKETEAEVLGSSFNFGSATYYEFDASTWAKLGSTMRPEPGLVETGGDFGASVSMARFIRRVAVGAPESSRDTSTRKTGRVYTYEYDGTDWRQMTPQPIFGAANSKLGSSMEMSADGSRLLLGAPQARGGDGSIFYYEWSDASNTNPSSGWKQILSLAGGTGEALGTTVALLNDNGNSIAFGGPSYGDLNQGLIRVYTNVGIWIPQGNDIVGAENEHIGKTVCGANGRVAFGTDTGTFHVYEYVQNKWVEVGTGPDLGSPVVSISMSEDAKTVVVGLANEEVRVYELS